MCRKRKLQLPQPQWTPGIHSLSQPPRQGLHIKPGDVETEMLKNFSLGDTAETWEWRGISWQEPTEFKKMRQCCQRHGRFCFCGFRSCIKDCDRCNGTEGGPWRHGERILFVFPSAGGTRTTICYSNSVPFQLGFYSCSWSRRHFNGIIRL